MKIVIRSVKISLARDDCGGGKGPSSFRNPKLVFASSRSNIVMISDREKKVKFNKERFRRKSTFITTYYVKAQKTQKGRS